MRLPHLISALILMLATVLPARAVSSSADAQHLHLQLVVPPSALVRGQPAKAGLYFKLEHGWHVYWKNAGDSGEPPRMKWTLPEGIAAGPLLFPAPKRLPLGPLMDFGYEDEVLFPFSITASPDAKGNEAVLHAKVDWLVCREVCIPGKAELEIRRLLANPGDTAYPADADASLYERLSNRVPPAPPATFKAGFKPTAQGFRLTVLTGQKETQAAFFPADQNILDNPAPQKVTPAAQGLTLDLKKDANLTANPAQLRGVIELSDGRAYDIAVAAGAPAAATPVSEASSENANTGSPANSADRASPASPSTPGLGRIVALAFLGGLILNLMPCVFPVLFLKGLALVQSGAEERHRLRMYGLVYTAGILVSFWILVAVLLALRGAGARLGWGFQFQSPVFLSLMAGLLFFLALSLAGQFEIGLSLTGAGGGLAARQGYTGSFFTGVLAVIVATPCTAPFMGAAIGYALAQSAVVTFAVFTALALGLAAPYLVLAFQPAWTRILPKPGAWMEVLRQAVSVPIFATVIWLAWVLANAYGATLLAALLVGFLLIAIAGWFLGRWPAKGWATSVAAVILIAVVGLNVFVPRAVVVPGFSPDKVLTLKLKTGSDWEPWSQERVNRYLSEGHPVFVDFTASWCLSCQVNERLALSKPEVMKAFEDAHVVLLKADWTQHDDVITDALAKLGRSGVPVYALYVPGESSPRLLPEALTPGIVTNAIASLPRSATQPAVASSNPQ